MKKAAKKAVFATINRVLSYVFAASAVVMIPKEVFTENVTTAIVCGVISIVLMFLSEWSRESAE